MLIGGFDGSEKELLSAMADGELDASGLAASCAAWRREANLRADWHAWHLIGDVLRSEDLATDPRGDRRLCASVRQRLQSEPVILAPITKDEEATGSRRIRRPSGWGAVAAVAAGVVLVAGTFAVLRPNESSPPSRLALGQVSTPSPPAAPAPVPSAATLPAVVVAESQVIRDAKLDRYLEAHKQFAGTSALGVPSAFLRSATVDSAAR